MIAAGRANGDLAGTARLKIPLQDVDRGVVRIGVAAAALKAFPRPADDGLPVAPVGDELGCACGVLNVQQMRGPFEDRALGLRCPEPHLLVLVAHRAPLPQ